MGSLDLDNADHVPIFTEPHSYQQNPPSIEDRQHSSCSASQAAPQRYNPLGNTCLPSVLSDTGTPRMSTTSSDGRPSRYNPLAQSYPPFSGPIPNMESWATSCSARSSEPTYYGYNPFFSNYPPFPSQEGTMTYGALLLNNVSPLFYPQGASDFNAISDRGGVLHTKQPPPFGCYPHAHSVAPPSMLQAPGFYHHQRSFSGNSQFPDPPWQQFQQFPDFCPPPSPRQFQQRGGITPSNVSYEDKKLQKLLWLSEEEAEIIRLIRLCNMKESTRPSNFSVSEEQFSPAISSRIAHLNHEDAGPIDGNTTNRSSRCSNVSTCSDEDFTLPLADHAARVMREANVCRRKSTSQINSPRPLQEAVQYGLSEKQRMRVVAARRNSAATYIQKCWRRYMLKKTEYCEEQLQLAAFKFITGLPIWQHQFLKIAVTLQAMRRGKLVKRWYSSLQKAASTIQRAWRDLVRRRREQCASAKDLPKELKDVYGLIRRQHTIRGLSPPSYERFVKLVDRIQAATEGARVRRRLRSRRLQTIIKEIKEIRVLLLEMSHETVNESSPNLIPQFSTQLQQKLTQLHMALHGPEDAARFLLRRSPATPLVIYTSRATSPNSFNLTMPKSGDQLFNKASLLDNTAHSKLLLSRNLSTDEEKHSSPQMESMVTAAVSKNKSCLGFELPAKGISVSTGLNDYDLLAEPKFETAERTQSPDEKCNFELTGSDANDVDHELGYEPSCTIVNMERPSFQIDNNNTKKSQNSEAWDHSDRPKRPFLRRKSMAMASQKLDWSKVKPMVSSRLEPELKTKLFKCKSKDGFRAAFLKKKINYARIKSRLFNYEKLIQSPRDSVTLSKNSSTGREVEKGISRPRNSDVVADSSHIEPGDLRYINDNIYRGHRHQHSVSYCSETEQAENAIYLNKPQTASGSSPRCKTERVISKHWNENFSLEKNSRKTIKLCYSKIDEKKKIGDLECHHIEDVVIKKTQVNESRRRNYGHSNRYRGSKVYSQGLKVQLGKKEGGQDGMHLEKKQNGHDCNMELTSLEVENAFRKIMALKYGKNISINSLFESFKGRTTIPRLHPESDIFQGSSYEKRRLHDALLQNGRASKLQPDSLAFISIRD
ncbi:hypothetical protein O6H91_03G011100 [Diphasiastrum complanatum]|uniref:Uncharacterized protein n=1 Tax=Diphasiastrum complanatum TaxID=34168 RepID=A0ACC2E3F4_DIPCM|nr:hypothetical protein O6H91_03G011100 [Diphasiastrum complanatum]